MSTALLEREASRDALPVCLSPSWIENPYELVSLADVLNCDAGNFLDTIAAIRFMEGLLVIPSDQEKIDLYMGNVGSIQRDCERLGLNVSAIQARRIVVLWQQRAQPVDVIREHVRHLLRQIADEMSSVCFYYITPDKAPYVFREPIMPLAAKPRPIRLKAAFEYFGSGVIKRFMPVERDLREALKCAAYECRPACVFHLMRATEIGIPKVAKLNAASKTRDLLGELY